MKESVIERKFRLYCESQGWLCLKINPAWYASFPDRLVVYPDRPAEMIELKKWCGRLRPGQRKRIIALRRKGFRANYASSLKRAIELTNHAHEIT